MTATFDWAGLWQGAEAAKHDCMFCDCDAPNEAAAAYLRTRIEAAFVPVDRYIERNRLWTEQVLATNEATARAEAAEARVAEITAQLAEARESERAAVVVWLRGMAVKYDMSGGHDEAVTLEIAADTIEAGEHLT